MKKTLLLFISFVSLFSIQSRSQSCVDSSLIHPTVCSFIYDPVCGCNGVTYSNACVAVASGGVTSFNYGDCNSQPVGCNADFTYTINGNTVTFTNTSSSMSSIFNWDFGDFAGTSTMTNPTYTYSSSPIHMVVCLTMATSGCSAQHCEVLEPLLSCNANFTHIDSCMDTYFSNTSTGSYSITSWNFGDGTAPSLQTNPSHHYASPGDYGVCLTVSTSSAPTCTDTYCDTVHVHQPTPAGFNWHLVGTNPAVVSFTGLPSQPNFTYFWQFGDNSTGSNATEIHTYLGCDYLVCVYSTDSTGCMSSFCDSIHLCNTGISTAYNSALFVWPTLVQNNITIQNSLENGQNISFKIFDAMGQLMNVSSTKSSINCQSLADGMYLLVLTDENGNVIYRTRFMKQ